MQALKFCLLGLCVAIVASCSRATDDTSPSSSPAHNAVHTETFWIGSREHPRYTILVQRSEPGNTGMEQDYQFQGEEAVRDWTRITWDESKEIVVDRGKLTINGKERGQLPRGAEVVVSPAGEVTITPPPMDVNEP